MFLDWCCGTERAEVKDVQILEYILLDWRIWHRAETEVWSGLLWQLEQLLNPDNPHVKSNHLQFTEAKALIKILLTSKVSCMGWVWQYTYMGVAIYTQWVWL